MVSQTASARKKVEDLGKVLGPQFDGVSEEELKADCAPAFHAGPRISGAPVINALPLEEGSAWKLQANFKGYYKYPCLFYNKRDPYDDWIFTLDGPRGGGKTTAGTALSIFDGQMRGIPVISNVPISWTAWDSTGRPFIVQSIPFNVVDFVKGDESLYFKRVFLDEANYNMDRLRSTSTKNLQIADILQQARKFRMTIVLATINANWIDSRATYMCDISISVKDLYNTPYGRKHGMAKGKVSQWDMWDVSGKKTGMANHKYMTRNFNNSIIHGIFDTFLFQNSLEQRKKLNLDDEKMITDQDGNLVKKKDWLNSLKRQVASLAKSNPVTWSARDLWDTLRIDEPGLRMIAGRCMKDLGIEKTKDYRGNYGYNLGEYVEEGENVPI